MEHAKTTTAKFCMRSLIGANAKPSRLNLAWIDSSPCSPRRPKPTWILSRIKAMNSRIACLVEMKHILNPTCTLNVREFGDEL
ncbi:hypothetical protein EMCRGX_G018517 [Ephydatia muelleri]